jgi:hypothetical protein
MEMRILSTYFGNLDENATMKPAEIILSSGEGDGGEGG